MLETRNKENQPRRLELHNRASDILKTKAYSEHSEDLMQPLSPVAWTFMGFFVSLNIVLPIPLVLFFSTQLTM